MCLKEKLLFKKKNNIIMVPKDLYIGGTLMFQEKELKWKHNL